MPVLFCFRNVIYYCTLAPHFSQKVSPGFTEAPQFWQNPTWTSAPHEEQKRAPGSSEAPHFGQILVFAAAAGSCVGTG
jgi:hypothetical protein